MFLRSDINVDELKSLLNVDEMNIEQHVFLIQVIIMTVLTYYALT